MPHSHFTLATLVALSTLTACPSMAQEIKTGFGRQVITPEKPMWLAGYASRSAPSEGKLHDLWAKALAVEDSSGVRAVLVTTDLIGMPANIAQEVARMAQDQFGIPRERLMLTASHTHSGPVIKDGLLNMYGLDEAQMALVREYTATLPERILAAIQQAVENLSPGTLEWGLGEAGFAGNRRSYTLSGIANDLNPIGVTDRSVPVLAAKDESGKLKGIFFLYACHNTTLGGQQFCGDYAGFAQAELEAKFPGVVALFASGCGGDQNPYPRREVALAEQHGGELAAAVEKVLQGPLQPVQGPLRAVYEEIALQLSEPPTREAVEAQLTHADVYIQRRAKHLLRQWDEAGGLATTYPYPIQVWQFADSLQLTALAGEVVVDYALRLKHELGQEKHFVIAYANDCPAYIPSLRVLREGGYEGETSMIYYGLYGPWAPTIENDIISKVHELSQRPD